MAKTNANLIWTIADLLRGGRTSRTSTAISPPLFPLLRRLDCFLEPTEDEVLAEHKKVSATKVDPDGDIAEGRQTSEAPSKR